MDDESPPPPSPLPPPICWKCRVSIWEAIDSIENVQCPPISGKPGVYTGGPGNWVSSKYCCWVKRETTFDIRTMIIFRTISYYHTSITSSRLATLIIITGLMLK